MPCRRLLGVAALLLAFAVAVSPGGPAGAQSDPGERGNGVPRYVSLRSGEVNVRSGPGVRYPVKWVFVQKDMPVEVVAEYDTWRKIRDWEGAEGWVHRAMLSSRRSIIVTGETHTVRRRASEDAPAVARLAPGTVALLDKCEAEWCQVTVGSYEGWVSRAGLWGLYRNETLQ